MKKTFLILTTLLLATACVVGGVRAYTVISGDTLSEIAYRSNKSLTEIIELNPQITNPDLIYVGDEINLGGDEIVLGGTTPIAGSTYNLAGSGVNSSATSFTLQSFTIKQTGQKITDSDLGDIFYFTIEPGNNTRQEVLACTTLTQNAGGTATVSGCSRGMSPITPYTASTTLAFAHAGGSQVILSDPPQLFNLYTAKANDETIAGTWNFTAFPTYNTSTDLCTANGQFCTKYYIDTVGAGGFTSANVGTTRGLYALGTSPETVGINLHAQSGLAFESGSGKLKVSTTTESATGLTILDNVLKVATTTDFVWSGSHTFSGSFQNANATTTGKLNLGFNSLENATSTLNVSGDSYFTGNATTTGTAYFNEIGINSIYYDAMPYTNLYTSSSDIIITNAMTVHDYTTPSLSAGDKLIIKALTKSAGSDAGYITLSLDGTTTTVSDIVHSGNAGLIGFWDIVYIVGNTTNKGSIYANGGRTGVDSGQFTPTFFISNTSTIDVSDGIQIILSTPDISDYAGAFLTVDLVKAR